MWKLKISQEKRIYKKAREFQKQLEEEMQPLSLSHLEKVLGKRLRIEKNDEFTDLILSVYVRYDGRKGIDIEEKVYDWHGQFIGKTIPTAPDQMRMLRKLRKLLRRKE